MRIQKNGSGLRIVVSLKSIEKPERGVGLFLLSPEKGLKTDPAYI